MKTGQIILTTLFAFGTVIQTAIADTKAIFETPDGDFVIEYRDQNNVRFSMAKEGFMLISSGKPYILMRQEGTWTAIPAEGMQKMMPNAAQKTQQTRLTPTGQKETIAGFQGESYTVEVGDSWSGDWQKEGEVTLSKAPETHAITQAMLALGEQFTGVQDYSNFQQVEGVDIKQVGMLASEDMRLKSLSNAGLPNNIFQLPPDVKIQEMPDMNFGNANSPAGASEQEQQSFLEDLLESTQDEAKEETKRGTMEGVGDAVRDGIRGFFN